MKYFHLAILSLGATSSFAFTAPTPVNKNILHKSSTRVQTNIPNLAYNELTVQKNMVSEKVDANTFFGGFFPKFGKQEAPKEPEKPKIPDVVVDSDYWLGGLFAFIGALIYIASSGSLLGTIQGGIHILLASFFAVQARRIRFVFDSTAFELKNVDFFAGSDEVLLNSGENFVVGGANRWDYDTFVNWEFFPNVDFPILVYFKETQTPEESWNEGPGQLDKVGGGQIHFFPAIANAKQLKEQFELRGCAKK